MAALWKDVAPSELRYLYLNDHMSMTEIAHMFDVREPTISKALKGVTTVEERKNETSRHRAEARRHSNQPKIPKLDYNKVVTPVVHAVKVDQPKKVELTMPMLNERHTMELQGKTCVFIVDMKAKTVEFSDKNGGMLNGMVDKGGLHLLLRELQQIEDFLSQS